MAIDGSGTLQPVDRPLPSPEPGQVRIRVRACAVCHTELDELEGRLPAPAGRIPGHQVVGVIDAAGDAVPAGWVGKRVGLGWIFHACGNCDACRRGLENLCPFFLSTGCDVDGGYAEAVVAPVDFVHVLAESLTDVQAAPLLCAGAIGCRALDRAQLVDGEPLGLTGFGASGHLVLSLARLRYPRSPVFVFARGASEREFALERGAAWAGTADETAPQPLAAIIDTTPVWTPVVRALAQLAPGGRLVVNAIRKESVDQKVLLELDYAHHLWSEKTLTSVANVTRADIRACLDAAAQGRLQAEVTTYPLKDAGIALADLKRGGSRGAKVLLI